MHYIYASILDLQCYLLVPISYEYLKTRYKKRVHSFFVPRHQPHWRPRKHRLPQISPPFLVTSTGAVPRLWGLPTFRFGGSSAEIVTRDTKPRVFDRSIPFSIHSSILALSPLQLLSLNEAIDLIASSLACPVLFSSFHPTSWRPESQLLYVEPCFTKIAFFTLLVANERKKIFRLPIESAKRRRESLTS